MKRTLLLIFLIFSINTTAQESTLLKGQILADSLEGSSINIVNLTQETGTINNSQGQFEIKVEEGDTLLFSSVQYEIRKIVISKEIFSIGYLEVSFDLAINELKEVNISNTSLSGNLSADISNIGTFDQASVGFPLSSVPKLTSVERKIYTASSTSFDLILNMLNGRLKMLKKAAENIEYESLIDLGVEIFPIEFYFDYLKIPEDKTRLFVYYCGEDARFKNLLIKKEALSLIEFYIEKSTDFREMHNMEVK